MGNDQSVEMDGGLTLQSEGAEHLWSLQLNRGKAGEGEGVGVFTRTRGGGTQDDLCRAGLEVRRIRSCTNTRQLMKYVKSHVPRRVRYSSYAAFGAYRSPGHYMTFECSLERFWGLVTGRAHHFVSLV